MKRAKKLTCAAQKAAMAKVPTRPDIPLSFTSPESTNIARASYATESQILSVTFKPKDETEPERTYWYGPVPLALWQEFEREALSKGKFFANCIKPYYPATAV